MNLPNMGHPKAQRIFANELGTLLAFGTFRDLRMLDSLSILRCHVESLEEQLHLTMHLSLFQTGIDISSIRQSLLLVRGHIRLLKKNFVVVGRGKA